MTRAAIGAAVAALVAVRMLLEQRRQASGARGRMEFMAGSGVFVSTVFIALILLGGIASLYIAHCHQS